MSEASLFRPQSMNASTAKGIALNLTKGAFYMGYSSRIVFLLLLKGKDVAVLDA
jgi:hypothetical protein